MLFSAVERQHISDKRTILERIKECIHQLKKFIDVNMAW